MSIEVDVALHQGRYYRAETKTLMSDFEYLEWLKKQHLEFPMEGTGAVAIITLAHKNGDCASCHYPIPANHHYYRIQWGKGLGAMKFPVRIHLGCWGEYWSKRIK